jgi:hypothetical protein
VTEAATRAGEPLDDAFSKLLGRQATDAERERLHRVRDVLGLGGNDALWLVLLALEHYDSLTKNATNVRRRPMVSRECRKGH